MYRSVIFTAATLFIAASAAYAAAPAAGSSATTDSGESRICRRISQTDSLVGYVRVCKTRREWNEAAAQRTPGASRSCRSAANGAQCPDRRDARD